MLDLATVKGEDFFRDIGEWVMKAVAYFHVQCAEENVEPCIHLETIMMTREDFSAHTVDALLDELGIVHRGT